MARVFPGFSTATYDATDRTNVQLTYPGTTQRYDKSALTIVCTGTPSAGSVTVRIKAINSTRYLALLDEFGVPVTISLSTKDHIIINGPIDGVELDIASLGTATAWRAILAGVAE